MAFSENMNFKENFDVSVSMWWIYEAMNDIMRKLFDTFKVNLRYVDSLMSVWWLSYDFEVWTVELKLDFALELTAIFTLK